MKKKEILLMLFILCFFLVSMKHANIVVPKAVKEGFKAKYSSVQKVKWEREADNIYEAEFKMSGKEMTAEFKEDGTWICTETELKKQQLPEDLKSTIQKHFSGYKIDEVELVELPDNIFQYEVELEKRKSEIEALFDIKGNLISTVMNSETEEED